MTLPIPFLIRAPQGATFAGGTGALIPPAPLFQKGGVRAAGTGGYSGSSPCPLLREEGRVTRPTPYPLPREGLLALQNKRDFS